MKILFLGTGSAEGYPASFCNCRRCSEARSLGGRNIRYRSSILVDDTLLVDLPPDLYAASLRCGASLARVEAVLVTHTHPDHFYVDELRLRASPFSLTRPGRLVLVGSAAAARAAQGALQGYGAGVEFKPVEPGWLGEAAGHEVLAVPAVHNVPPGEEPLNYAVGRGGTWMLYAADTGLYGREQVELLRRALGGRRLSLVVADATMGTRGPGAYRFHMSFADAERLREMLLDAGLVGGGTPFLLTHFSHNGSPLHDELAGLLDAPFSAAHDCLEVEV